MTTPSGFALVGSFRSSFRRLRGLAAGSVGLLGAVWGVAAAPASPLTISGDLRLRYEWDWDSQNAAGVPRTDRDRARLRARVGAGVKLSDEWSFGARVRTGSKLSQQSPHLTFSSNDDVTDDLKFQLDRYFLQYKALGFTGWVGRNSTPFWQQNEMFWDEDVTPTGVAASYESRISTGALTATAGAFYLPDGAVAVNGRLFGTQLKYGWTAKPSQFVVAAGLYAYEGREGAANLRNRNGARDYLVGVVSAQWVRPLAGGLPLTLGVDVASNFKDYGAAAVAPLAVGTADETTGVVLSVQVGQLKQAHDWLVGYWYAEVGALAVNASYAQDDWQRFGSATQTDGTDIKGHEFRAAYALSKSVNVMARLFLVEAITSRQDGKRFRIDLNWKF